ESFDQQYAAIQLHLAKNSPEILLSIPDWLHKYGMEQLPDRWMDEMTAMHGQAPVFVRVNTLKSSPKELIRSLRQNDIEAKQSTVVQNALEIMGRPNLFRTEAFKEGAFEVQDISSQMATLALDPKPGERVIDACAGAGGKSLHIAMQMENKGHLISMDTEIKKLETLRQRARRAGISNLETRAIESSKTIKRLANSADRLILDVPCTGSGVYRRNPDAKYRLSPEFVQNILQVQSSILNDYGKMLKPGGIMVYATCSLFPDENERQVESFMAKNAETFELISSQSISTAATGQDGFFIAKFKKLGK
ncbi:MAG: RsmB/NOP family class I SAM-dependent RNA methyltransferase, partial [Saprospiraceae bacterium]